MVVVVAMVTMPARSSHRWSRLGRRQLPPRATRNEPLLRPPRLCGTRNEPLLRFYFCSVYIFL